MSSKSNCGAAGNDAISGGTEAALTPGLSPTPRTDAAEEYCGGNCMGRDWVSADFARALERELAEAVSRLSNAQKRLDAIYVAAGAQRNDDVVAWIMADKEREAYAEALTATFQIVEKYSGAFVLQVTTPNGDVHEFTSTGEHAQRRVLRQAHAALRIAPGTAGNGVPLKVPQGANRQAPSVSREESGTSSNLGAAPELHQMNTTPTNIEDRLLARREQLKLFGPEFLIDRIITLERDAAHTVTEFPANSSVCEWESMYDDCAPAESSCVKSGCGHEWMSDDADPPGRWMKFCPFCGKPAAFALIAPIVSAENAVCNSTDKENK